MNENFCFSYFYCVSNPCEELQKKKKQKKNTYTFPSFKFIPKIMLASHGKLKKKKNVPFGSLYLVTTSFIKVFNLLSFAVLGASLRLAPFKDSDSFVLTSKFTEIGSSHNYEISTPPAGNPGSACTKMEIGYSLQI